MLAAKAHTEANGAYHRPDSAAPFPVCFEREEDMRARLAAGEQAAMIAELEATELSSDAPDTPPYGDSDVEYADFGAPADWAAADEDVWLQDHGVFDSSDDVGSDMSDY